MCHKNAAASGDVAYGETSCCTVSKTRGGSKDRGLQAGKGAGVKSGCKLEQTSRGRTRRRMTGDSCGFDRKETMEGKRNRQNRWEEVRGGSCEVDCRRRDDGGLAEEDLFIFNRMHCHAEAHNYLTEG